SLAKRIWPDRTEPYSRARHVDVTSAPLTGGLDDIAALLQLLIGDPHAAVMRGQLIDPNRTTGVRRLLYTDRKTGEAPVFTDTPRRWVALDIEGVTRPHEIAVHDLAACAGVAIALLPSAFAEARCIVQATASHGIKPDIRLRLWFWLSRDTAGAELKRWLAGTPADPAAFGAVQPIYTAAPIFMAGTVDPLPGRLAERAGRAAVEVPSTEALAPPPEPPRDMAPREPIPEAVAARFIDRVLERVRGAPDGQRHAALRGAAVSLGGIQDRAGFTDATATRWLLDALDVPASRQKDTDTVAWGLANGRTRPIALEITAKPRNGAGKPANLPDNATVSPHQPPPADPEKYLAGEIALVRRGIQTSLPAYYPAPTEPRASALERQVTVIHDTIAEATRRAAARQEVLRRRNAEIADMGLPGLNLAPAKQGAITRRLHKLVAAELGYGKRIPLAPRVLTTGAQATGKTAAAIEAVAAITEPLNVWFTETTLAKAIEVADDYAAAIRDRPGSLPAVVVRGRGQPDPQREGRTMCDRAEIARQVAEAGLSVRKTLCPACPFLDTCGYRQQAARIEDMQAGVYFLASAYLFLPSPAPTPDILIIDEQVTITAVDTAEIEVAALDPFMIAGLGIDTRETLNTLRLILVGTEPALRALRSAGIDKAELDAVIRSLDNALDHAGVNIDGSMDDEAIADRLDNSARHDILNARKVVAAVRREIDMPRDGLNGVAADRKVITVSRLRPPRGIKHAAVMAMDGTGDETLNRTLFGSTLQHERIAIERDAFITGTIAKKYSRQSMTGIDANGKPIASKTESAAKLRAEIGDIASAMPGRCAVFSNQTTIDALIEDETLHEHAPVGHFNKLRGLNEWEHCRSALVPGQNSIRIGELESLARAYMVADPVPFVSMDGPLAPDDKWECKQWPFVACQMRRMRDGSLSPVFVQVHPDPRCQRVLEQIREAECVQAADRVRPIFNRRDLTFMNALCLDVTYDVIRTHRELVAGGNPLERAFAMTGLLPLNAEDLYRAHPGRFVSVRAALRALENYPPPAKRTSLCEGGEVSYRTEGQRGPASKALVDFGWHRDPLAALTLCLGIITEFQGVKLAEPCPMPGRLPVQRVGGVPAVGSWPTSAPFARPMTHAPPCD
ncbi:MAG: hypothetical protein ABSC06_36255, partial [Rhodopila sp.]